MPACLNKRNPDPLESAFLANMSTWVCLPESMNIKLGLMPVTTWPTSLVCNGEFQVIERTHHTHTQSRQHLRNENQSCPLTKRI